MRVVEVRGYRGTVEGDDVWGGGGGGREGRGGGVGGGGGRSD